tara:strand:- start:35 stop:433 length:399 start_codon:yes stop_codon:yes gene_type:complete
MSSNGQMIEDIPKKTQSQKPETNITSKVNKFLLPMPESELEEATKTVMDTRNPFVTLNSENSGYSILPRSFKFTGITKTDDYVYAFVNIEEEDKVLTIGDSIGNGFVINTISYINRTLEVTNGVITYTLLLK